MHDPIARCLVHLLALLFPARGTHRPTPAPQPTPPAPAERRTLRPLPARKSPYAHAAASNRPFLDTIPPVRPYVLAPSHRTAPTEKEAAQAHRRWALDMAARGLDVGPDKIHGVHLLPGSRTIHLSTAA